MVLVCQIVLSLFSLWMIGIGIWSMARPRSALNALSKMGSTNLINYTELGIRLTIGWGFIGGASLFNAPHLARIFGIFLVTTSIILMLIPKDWHAAYSVYWSKKLPTWSIWLFMPFGISFGVFLLVAVWN